MMKFLLVLSWLIAIFNFFFFVEDGSFFGVSAILVIVPTMIFICYKKLENK